MFIWVAVYLQLVQLQQIIFNNNISHRKPYIGYLILWLLSSELYLLRKQLQIIDLIGLI